MPVEKQITVEEWLSALERIDAPSADAMTVAGWAKKLGIPKQRASDWLRDGLAHGWVERALVCVENISGTTRTLVGFRVVAQPKGHKGGKK